MDCRWMHVQGMNKSVMVAMATTGAKGVTLRISHITTVIVTLNTPNNLEHVRIFIPQAPTLGIPETPEHHMLGTDSYVDDSSHISSTRKVDVYITRESIFPLIRKSIRLLEILHKNVLCLRDHRNVVVKSRWWLAFAHRSTQIWQYVWHDRRGVRLGDAITQRKRRIITFWR